MITRDRNALPAVSGFGNGTRFTGKERDQETGLDYFGGHVRIDMTTWIRPDQNTISDEQRESSEQKEQSQRGADH